MEKDENNVLKEEIVNEIIKKSTKVSDVKIIVNMGRADLPMLPRVRW